MVELENKGTIDTVQVALRIRPLMQNETDRGCDECIDVVAGYPQVQIKDLAFTYNHVFPQHINQQEFYDTATPCKKILNYCFNFPGYNVTILAYGQTGSGVIPQAVADIFDFIETHEDKFIFKVNVSFMELYQEQCYDLLSGKERGHSVMEIREDINKGVILPERGSSRRVTGSTAMNQASSRSHAVFTIIIAKESRSDNGERLKEGVKINQGLLALGNVISALGDGTNRSFISYRDSKLTRLLQDSLGGNSLTLMVACVSPADYNLDETVSTLREQNNEQLQEELDRERTKYSELLKKHKQVTEHLGNMLIENTNLCEKALLAEAAKDKIERKLNELTEQCNQTIDNLNMTEKTDDENQRSSVVDYLKEIKLKLEDLQSVNLKTNEELIDHEIKLSFAKDDNDADKVALNQELQELNRAMAIKASVVQAILANNKEMLEGHNNLRENEEKISHLEKERDELLQHKDPTHEERRTKVSNLESQITDLKKRCQQQANSEKFRKWKADNERAMLRLKNEDRKRATAMAKMESLHAKQQNKQTHMKRNAKGSVKAGAIQQAWITEQIEGLRNSTDDQSNRKKIGELEDDLALRKAQISDLQQKILTADQAKVALKCLFELLVDSKRELQSQSEKGFQARYEEVKEAHDRLLMEFDSCKSEFERQLAVVKMQSEQKKKLVDELEQLRAAGNKAKNKKPKKEGTETDKKVQYVEATDEEIDDFEDTEKDDPDWRATPLFKRIHPTSSEVSLETTPPPSFFNNGFTSHELCGSKSEPSTPKKSIATRPKRPLRARNNVETSSWMFALLLYNTCVAPMSSYCANSIFQYGMDVAKYNVIANVLKFMAKEVILMRSP
ncbi:Kinesin-like protein at 3A [Operophtera brumata]|uniref:Kinesin-like protein at 3A n=1 Tax=Operophtera brumata TaxID=104452 RepID=A0A0L7LLF9_OPEBR|nr:Kinesin-like protein at 3A [Operophtera brumata]